MVPCRAMLSWYTTALLRNVALIRLLRSHLPPRGRLLRWPPLAAGSDGWFRVVPCCLGTLRLCCGTWPSSVCFAATFPPGEGFFGGTTLTEPSPRGKVGRAKPGSDEGNLPQALRRVLTYPSLAEPRKKRLTNPLVSCMIIAKKDAVAFPTASQTIIANPAKAGDAKL